MRIDKYIWAVRLFKTRSLASKACQSGQVKINEAESKASKEIKIGDLISVRFNPIWKTYKVLAIPKSRIRNYFSRRFRISKLYTRTKQTK